MLSCIKKLQTYVILLKHYLESKGYFLECCSRVKLRKNQNETKYIMGLGLYEIDDERPINNHPQYYNRAEDSKLLFSEEGWVVSLRHFFSYSIISFHIRLQYHTYLYYNIFLSCKR